MPDATERPIAEWSETDWLTKLVRLACQLTACAADAAGLAHTCLCAFHKHFGCYLWQHPDPPSAWRWCCQFDAGENALSAPCSAQDPSCPLADGCATPAAGAGDSTACACPWTTPCKDSGELVNTSNRTKLLYRVEIRPPDPEAVIATINVAGTELGEGSFIRVVALDLEGNPIRTRTEDYKRVHLENRLYKRISVYECQAVLELWGAPGTRNRLRVNRVRYFYPGRPIEPDIPPGAPRPASGK